MDQHEATFYNQAITLAKMGHREQAYSFFKKIANNNPQDQQVIFWMVYTAPSLEKAQELLDRAHTINPDSPALQQADQWLTNEKLRLPQPAEGYKLFPPANHQSQLMPYGETRATLPYYNSSNQLASYYQPPQLSPYQPVSTYQYQPYPAYHVQPYPVPAYPVPYYRGPAGYPQPYYRQNYAYWNPPYPVQAYPPVRWGQSPSYAYNSYLAMG